MACSRLVVGLAASMCLGMSACAVSAPEPALAPQTVQLPEQWNSATLDASSISSEWWRELNDPVLGALIDEALRNSPTLHAALASVDASLAQAGIAKADILPSVSVGGSAQRSKQYLGSAPNGDPVHRYGNSFGAQLQASWELDLWGRIRNASEAALAEVQAEQAAYEGARLSLIAQVIKAYLACTESHLNLEIQARALATASELATRIERRYTAGTASQLDLRQARASVARAEALVALYQRLRDNGLRQLAILVGRYPEADLDLVSALPTLPATTPAGLPAQLLARRPDLVEAERRYSAAIRRVASADAARYPTISLTASAGTASSDLKDLLDGDFSVWSLLGNVAMPLFTGGRLKSNVELAEAGERAQLALYAASVLRACGEVESALASESWLQAESDAYARAVSENQQAYDLADQRYQRGVSDLLTLLSVRQALEQSQAALVGAQRARIEARVDLIIALGGGFGADELRAGELTSVE